MAKEQPRSGAAGTGAPTAESDQVIRPAGPVTPRAAAPWFTGFCRRTWRAVSAPGQGEDKAEVAARLAWTGAALRRATGKAAGAGIRASLAHYVTYHVFLLVIT